MAEQNLGGEESDSGAGSIYQFKRCNSSNSLHAVTSSANTTDDEDSDMGAHLSMRDRRREAHTQAEQKRRDAIKRGYEELQDLVPMCQNPDNNQNLKLSKATILQKTVDYIHYMQTCKKKQEDDVDALRKEMVAMTIMKLNYDQIVSAHQSQPGNVSRQVPDDVKFEVFRAMIDSLFQTFDPCITTTSFAEISGSVIQWVEEHCKPQILREVMSGILQQLQNHEYATSMANNPSVANNIHPHVSVVDPIVNPTFPVNSSHSSVERTLSNDNSSQNNIRSMTRSYTN